MLNLVTQKKQNLLLLQQMCESTLKSLRCNVSRKTKIKCVLQCNGKECPIFNFQIKVINSSRCKKNSNAKITAWYTEIIPKYRPSCYSDDAKSETALLMGYFTLNCDRLIFILLSILCERLMLLIVLYKCMIQHLKLN